nr:MAG TPA: hypothetical protein [Caudoviricetes sp.]
MEQAHHSFRFCFLCLRCVLLLNLSLCILDAFHVTKRFRHDQFRRPVQMQSHSQKIPEILFINRSRHFNSPHFYFVALRRGAVRLTTGIRFLF